MNEESYSNLVFLYLSAKETLIHLSTAIFIYIFLCFIVYIWLTKPNSFFLVENIFKKYPKCSRVLIVIAHPDDECMFFGPTILSLAKRKKCQIYLLCLSNGNFDNLGKVRKQELWNACKILGIQCANITLLNATNLPDDPNTNWKIETVASNILKAIASIDAELLITFDRDGVTNHSNHCAIYYAVASLCLANQIPNDCKVLTLDSVSLFRKYTSLLDVPISLLFSKTWCILDWKDRRIVQTAMYQHKSQLMWFRKLYLKFSRYITINSLTEMNLSDVELEIQIRDM